MEVVLLVVHLFITLALTGVILLQRSEGGGLGMGGSSTPGGGLFSARGAANALTRTTAFLAAAFFATSISLTLIAHGTGTGTSIIDGTQPAGSAPTDPSVPAPLDPSSLNPSVPSPTGDQGATQPPADAKPAEPATTPAPAPAVPTP
jgi:preprotein translocase subunit SecG